MYDEDLQTALDEAGYKFCFEIGEWDYSWDITRVYLRDGHVFNLEDSGCSCFGFGDQWSDVHAAISAMVEVTKVPALDPGRHIDDNVINGYRALGLR